MTEFETGPNLHKKIQRLTERLLTGAMGHEEFEHFESVLLESVEARQIYIEHVNVHSQLSSLGGARELLEEDVFAGEVSRTKKSSTALLLTASGLLCCLLVAGVLLFQHDLPEPAPPAGFWPAGSNIGALIRAGGGQSGSQSSPSPLMAGQILESSANNHRIQLSNGVSCTLQGRSRIKLLSPSEVLLERGTLLAHVPPEAVGFRVDTQSARIIDLGTTFSVTSADDGGTELRVFQGSVSIRSKTAPQRQLQPWMVNAGETARLSSAGDMEVAPADLLPEETDRSLQRLYGIQDCEGAIRLLAASPASVQSGELQSDDVIYLIHEQSWAELSHPLPVTPPVAGTYVTPGGFTPLELPAGTRCTSFLLHCDFEDREQPLTGTIRFDRPILGIIMATTSLQESDADLGLKETAYPTQEQVITHGQSRGCVVPYAGKAENEDIVQIHEDGCSVSVTLNSPGGNIDQLRILVKPPGP